ncbi:MAG TPA: UbiD family decarboxylase [Burkholderiales bacterium]|nr:UbiD family decarboxylase [Burkholderiales bacterium]
MANPDLRDWLAQMDAAGELQKVSGANRQEEIGGIVDIYQRATNRPALLFDDIPGYPKGHRVVANILTGVKRIALTFGMPADSTEMDLVQYWKRYLEEQKTVAPTVMKSGPILENVLSGKEVNLARIPTPLWHEDDGGPYIGTACMVVMKDPDSGWINYGAYRVQSYDDPRIASVMCSKGKHGDLLMRRYHERGQRCPVAVVVGMHPLLFTMAGVELPYGKNEYDAVGGMMGKPVEVILGPKTGLPIPANAEIAFEGSIAPDDLIQEGPFGEWTGYFAGGLKQEPVIRIDTMMHRNDPILLGAVPAVPPNDDTFYRGAFRCAAVWRQLEAAGVLGIQGVWAHEAGGSRMWLTVSIKQMFPGHAKQAGLIASQCHAGSYANKYVVVVDDDIDPANMNDVIWAMCTRVDAREDVEILRTSRSGPLDPTSYPDGIFAFNSRMVIDACRPWARREDFPKVSRSSKELDERIKAKWSHVLPR